KYSNGGIIGSGTVNASLKDGIHLTLIIDWPPSPYLRYVPTIKSKNRGICGVNNTNVGVRRVLANRMFFKRNIQSSKLSHLQILVCIVSFSGIKTEFNRQHVEHVVYVVDFRHENYCIMCYKSKKYTCMMAIMPQPLTIFC